MKVVGRVWVAMPISRARRRGGSRNKSHYTHEERERKKIGVQQNLLLDIFEKKNRRPVVCPNQGT